MTMENFCDIHLHRRNQSILQEKISKNQNDWKKLKGTKISLHYRSEAMPMAPGRYLHADADLKECQIKWIFDTIIAEQAFPSRQNPGKLYRRVILLQLPGNMHVHDKASGSESAANDANDERQDLRALYIRDLEVSCQNKNSTLKEVGGSGSVVIGFGHQLVYKIIVGFMSNAARQKGGEFCLIIKKNKDWQDCIHNIPTDLFQCDSSNLKACFVDEEVIGPHADWGLMIETPRISPSRAEVLPFIFCPGRKNPKAGVRFSTFPVSEGKKNALLCFSGLTQLGSKHNAAVLIRNYLTSGPLQPINTFTSNESARLTTGHIELEQALGSKRSRQVEPSTVSAHFLSRTNCCHV